MRRVSHAAFVVGNASYLMEPIFNALASDRVTSAVKEENRKMKKRRKEKSKIEKRKKIFEKIFKSKMCLI